MLYALFLTFVPMVGMFSILLAFLIGGWQRLPMEHRRRLYPKLAIYPTFAAIVVRAPFALYFLLSPHPCLIADVWFGSLRLSTVFVPALLLPLLVLFFIVPISLVVERKLYGRPESSVVTKEERAAQRNYLTFSLLPVIVGTLAAALGYLAEKPLISFVGSLLLFVGILFGHRLQKQRNTSLKM